MRASVTAAACVIGREVRQLRAVALGPDWESAMGSVLVLGGAKAQLASHRFVLYENK